MHVIRTVSTLRTSLAKAGNDATRVGFVPTMGALHAGHLSLVARARAECDVVVVSVFVNSTQFNNAEDLTAYPRLESDDVELLNAAGADVAFMPSAAEMYPEGFATTIRVGPIAEPLEGAVRGIGHFEGVATVVAKLLNMVQPHVAYFGRKDAQQLLVVRQLVGDLDMTMDIVGCETVRDSDGLALSSRNARLSPLERTQAVGLSAALFRMRDLITNGEHDATALTNAGHTMLRAHGIGDDAVDYLAVVHPLTLSPIAQVHGPALLVVAAHVGAVRLIDNLDVHVEPT